MERFAEQSEKEKGDESSSLGAACFRVSSASRNIQDTSSCRATKHHHTFACDMKRKRKPHAEVRANKRHKAKYINSFPTKPLLLQYYPHVLTLRHYLASKLSKSSKKRQKRLLHYGNANDADQRLVTLLDKTIIGSFGGAELVEAVSIDKDLTVFTQQLSESSATITPTQGALEQSEVGSITVTLPFLACPPFHAA